MHLRVSAEFEKRFNELDFVLTNFGLFTVLSDSESIAGVDSRPAAMNILSKIKDVQASEKFLIERDVIHTELLSSGIKHGASLRLFDQDIKVREVLDMYATARQSLLLLTIFIIGEPLAKITATKLITELTKAAASSGLSSSLFKDLLTGIGNTNMNNLQTLLNELQAG